MPKVCVSDNLSITGTALGLAKWSVPRIVHDSFTPSFGDGAFGNLTVLPGRLLTDAISSWQNTSPIDQTVLLRVQRPYCNWVISNPNALQMRDNWTHVIAPAVALPPNPDPSSVYKSQVGGSVDMSSNSSGTPTHGLFWQWRDSHITEEILGPVPPGMTLSVWYRRYLWTPPPWSDNSNNGSPLNEAYSRGVRIIMLALPQLDGKFL